MDFNANNSNAVTVRHNYVDAGNDVVTNRSANTVAVLLNTTTPGATTPSFDSQPTFPSHIFATGNNPHAVALGRKGGRKGGLKGGKARWEGIPQEQRTELARRAALARWRKQ